MAVKPLSLTQTIGRAFLALTVTLFLTNTAPAVIDCISASHAPKSSCCAAKTAPPKEKGCCCEVSTTDGHPAVIAKAINVDEIAKVVLVALAPILEVESRAILGAPSQITVRERPPPQIVVIRLAPKRAPPIA